MSKQRATRPTTPMQRFTWTSPEYAEAFATLLRCCGEREPLHRYLRELISSYPRDLAAIDWGAGGGDLTRLLLEHFDPVYAVEPNAEMRTTLAAQCPGARVLDGTIATTAPPEKVAVGLVSHVYYHVPDHKWGAYTVHAARQLAADGVLVVTLKGPESGCNRMLEDFGAPRFDLFQSLIPMIRLHSEFDFSFTRLPGSICTESFEDTLTLARFMICDRDADAFSRVPTEAEFQTYVRDRFWDEKTGTGGWNYILIVCLVRRNPLFLRT